MQARLPATARHTRSPPRATLTLRHARQVLCRATALFGRADLLPRAARRRRAPHRLDLPPVCPSPRALHFTWRMSPCAAPQRAMQAKRARACCVRVHMRECAHVPLPRALRPRAIISTRACTWCYRCRHCRPQFPTAQPERAIWARSRPRAASRASEVRAEPKSSPPSASPAKRMPALRVPSAACRAQTPVCTAVRCCSCACATSCIIERDITDGVISYIAV